MCQSLTTVRSSPRIASQYRNVSYANLDDGPMHEEGEDEYESEPHPDDYDYDDDEFRPSKKSRGYKGGQKSVARRVSRLFRGTAR
jgi:hypothetical protein